MISIRIILSCVLMFLTLIVTNSKSISTLHDRVHTWHNVFSLNGTWYGTLQVMTENEQDIFFVENNTNQSYVQNPFTITESSSFVYGLVVGSQDDFNMMYSLTLTQKVVPEPFRSNSRICVFLIGAKAAADPMILPVSFNGNTTCTWKSMFLKGENFWVE